MKNPDSYRRQSRHDVSPFLPRNAIRVLEIGCGEGVFRENVPGAHEYCGVELSTSAAEIARQALDTVWTGTYDEVRDQIPKHRYDLIVCNDVIEHMADHDGFLEDIKLRMAENGCIVGSIPNVRHIANLAGLLWDRDWWYQAEGTLDRTHLRFFTERSLRRTFEDHQYTIELFGGINPIRIRRRNPFLKLAWLSAIALLGTDTRYLRFAFRIRPR